MAEVLKVLFHFRQFKIPKFRLWFGVGTAIKCCDGLLFKRCTDRVRSRTDNNDEVLEGKFRNLNFSPSSKKATEYGFDLFLSIYRYLRIYLKF